MRSASWIIRLTLALIAIVAAANCFLKYIWWAACYSAWAGIPRLTEQWRRAGTRASLFGWSVLLLELAGLTLVFSLIRLRPAGVSKNAFRFAVSLIITIGSTALLAAVLTWIKQT